MALLYPGFVAPQPSSTSLLDVLDRWNRGETQGRSDRNEADAQSLLSQVANTLYDTPGQKVARASAVMHPGRQPSAGLDLSALAPEAIDTYLGNVATAESGGDPNARNPRSSATGAFQITDGTWRNLVAQNPAAGLAPDGRTDPSQAKTGAGLLTMQNARALAKSGIPITPGALYSAHFLGAGLAPKVLSAAADTPLSALVPTEVMRANPNLAGMTAGQFTDWARQVGTNKRGGYTGPDESKIAGSAAMAPSGWPDAPTPTTVKPPKELLAALLRNPQTREFGWGLLQQSVKGGGVDRFQTFQGPDGATYQMNVSTGEMSLLRDGAKQAANAPQVETVFDPATGLEQKKVWNAQTGQWDDFGGTKAAPAAKPEFNVSQAAAAGYADRMAQANAIISKTDLATVQTDVWQKGLSGVPVIGNMMTSPEFQQADQAQRDFINAVLRRESGAVISDREFDNARRQYFPQPGDSPEVLTQKAANRRNAIGGVARSAGPAYSPPDTTNYLADPSSAPQSGDAARPQSQAEFDSLPSGSLYIDPEDGQTYRKD